MSTLAKSVAAGAFALAVAGGSLVHAQQTQERDQAAQGQQQRADDMAAYGDARIAALKAGLKLTPEQEKNWPALEQALKQAAKQRAEHYAAAHASADRKGDPIERLRTHADDLTTRGAALKSVADAAAPLYQSLDDAQKRRFVSLARFEMRQYARDLHRGHHRHHRGGDDSNGRRGGRDGHR